MARTKTATKAPTIIALPAPGTETRTKKITFLGRNSNRRDFNYSCMPDRFADWTIGPIIDHLPDGSVEISGDIQDEEDAKWLVAFANATDGFSHTAVRRGTAFNGAPTMEIHELTRASPTLIALVKATPVLISLLHWRYMSEAERLDHCRMHDIREEQASISEPNMLTILPKETKKYLSEWQKWINSGAQVRHAYPVGFKINELSAAGFVLAPFKPRLGLGENFQVPRWAETPGTPGSEAFVRKMMGPDYTHWISKFRC